MKIIKNILAITLSFAMILSLAACAKEDTPSQSVEPQATSEPQPQEEPTQPSEEQVEEVASDAPFVYEVRKIVSVDNELPETQGMSEDSAFSDYYRNVALFGNAENIEFYSGSDIVKSPVLPNMENDKLKINSDFMIRKLASISFERPENGLYFEDFSQKLVKERENNENYDSREEKTVSFMESADGKRQAVVYWSSGYPAEIECKVTEIIGVSNKDGNQSMLRYETGFMLTGANKGKDFEFFYDYCEEYLGVHFE